MPARSLNSGWLPTRARSGVMSSLRMAAPKIVEACGDGAGTQPSIPIPFQQQLLDPVGVEQVMQRQMPKHDEHRVV
jgi:hypothetical protein